MNLDKFSQNLEVLCSQIPILLQSTKSSPRAQQQLLTQAIKKLLIALEELKVSEEERHQQSEELVATRQIVEAERQRYQDLFELAPDGYLVTDSYGKIQEANRAAATLLNISQQFLMGKPLASFVAKSERRVFRNALNQLQQVNQKQEWEVCLYPLGGEPFHVAVTVATKRNQLGKVADLRWLLRDITSRKQVESELLHNAFHDALTGLPNRASLMNRLERAIQYAKRHEDYLFAVLFLDLDRFKVINDSLGHLIGDQLLISIAQRLKVFLRPSDTFARLGGDEFTILIEGIKEISDAIRVADRIQNELKLPFELGGQRVFTSTSIGIAFSGSGYDQPSNILRDADTAMYRAKSHSVGYEIFNIDMHIQAVARLQLETDLQNALERQEFRSYYQPIVSLETGRISGFEALIRWQHPQRGLISPAEFLQVARETGLSIHIDKWILAQACHQIQQWQQFPDNRLLTISINLCNNHFTQLNLIEQISQILQQTNLDSRSLKLEITENVFLENGETVIDTLRQLRSLGIELAIDDFGTGYSSLGRLNHFPINTLKIDRSFVSKMGIESGNLEIVEMLIMLAQKLGVEVIAEGVETAEQLAQLRALKCQYGQGYFFSHPLDNKTAEALIMAKPQW